MSKTARKIRFTRNNGQIKRIVSCFGLAFSSWWGCLQAESPNVLLIIADDLMKQIEAYGHSEVKTPHLKALSQDSVTFQRAYCQYPLCGPSRASLMTSLYPDRTGILYNQAGKSGVVQKKVAGMNLKTMPAYFKANGYITIGGGKLYHNSVLPGKPDSDVDFSVSLASKGRDGIKMKSKGKAKKITRITEASDHGPFDHKDGAVVKAACDWLDNHGSADGKQPFFMSVGIKKPHSPYSCPKTFWDEYSREHLVLPEVDIPNDILPHYSLSAPNALLKVHGDTNMYTGETLPHDKKMEMLHGYYACVTYADHLVGVLVKKLKEKGLYDNTIIVFTSDHGYKLGEYQRWAKFTLHEKDATVPLFVKNVSGKMGGQHSNSIVGLIDIYPSLSDMCGLAVPEGIDGISFKPVMKEPKAKTRTYIRTVLPRTESDEHPRAAGVSIIHDNGYRYHHWWEGRHEDVPKKFEDILAFELYDHYAENNSPLSLKNIAAQKPELLKEMFDLAIQPSF